MTETTIIIHSLLQNEKAFTFILVIYLLVLVIRKEKQIKCKAKAMTFCFTSSGYLMKILHTEFQSTSCRAQNDFSIYFGFWSY